MVGMDGDETGSFVGRLSRQEISPSKPFSIAEGGEWIFSEAGTRDGGEAEGDAMEVVPTPWESRLFFLGERISSCGRSLAV
jgi:hypothetical protein